MPHRTKVTGPIRPRPVRVEAVYSEHLKILTNLLSELVIFLTDSRTFVSISSFTPRLDQIRYPIEDEEHLTIWIFGLPSAGKSTLANALAAKDISRVGVGPTTRCPMRI